VDGDAAVALQLSESGQRGLARLVAGGVVVFVAAVFAFQQPWLLAVLAYGFVVRVLTGPTPSPLGLVVTRIVTPGLRLPPRYAPGPPKRFAQAVGALFSVAAAVLVLGFGLETAARVLVAVLGFFALPEAAVGLRLGCMAFAALTRLGLILERMCAACGDIWSRAEA
jgi:hypothetical protein